MSERLYNYVKHYVVFTQNFEDRGLYFLNNLQQQIFSSNLNVKTFKCRVF